MANRVRPVRLRAARPPRAWSAPSYIKPYSPLDGCRLLSLRPPLLVLLPHCPRRRPLYAETAQPRYSRSLSHARGEPPLGALSISFESRYSREYTLRADKQVGSVLSIAESVRLVPLSLHCRLSHAALSKHTTRASPPSIAYGCACLTAWRPLCYFHHYPPVAPRA